MIAVPVEGYNFADSGVAEAETTNSITSSTASSSNTAATPGSLTSSGNTLPTISGTTSKDKLSGGAKAGIGIGVALAVLLLAALAGAFWIYRRKRRQTTERASLSAPPRDVQEADSRSKYKDGTYYSGVTQYSGDTTLNGSPEMQHNQTTEPVKPAELPVGPTTAELHG